MRTITKKIDLYKFEELDKDIQEQLLDKEIEEQLECYCEDCLHDDMLEQGRVGLQDMFDVDYEKASNMLKEVYYDLSYSQGSGAMIEFTINFKDINDKYHILNNEEMRYIEDKGIINEIEIYHNDNFYYHEYTFDIKYYDNFGYWDYEDIKDDYKISEEDFNTIEDRIIQLLDTYNKHNTDSEFIKDIINLNIRLKNTGYGLIEDKDSFKEIAMEYLNDNEYTKDGEVYDC